MARLACSGWPVPAVAGQGRIIWSPPSTKATAAPRGLPLQFHAQTGHEDDWHNNVTIM
jgi:hypothetical protein